MLTFIGLATIIAVVGFLLSGRMAPIVALTLLPFIGALCAGFGLSDLSGFFTSGIAKVTPVATMFIFAILFFGVLQDTGIFRPIINGLIFITRGHIVLVTIGTGLVAVIAHLDGAGATTFLLTVPALLPLYERLNMNKYLLLMMLAIGAGIANMLPWAGPLGRAAAVTGLDVTELWHPLIPVQIIGILLLCCLGAWLGIREQRLVMALHGVSGKARVDTANLRIPAEEGELERPHLRYVNGAIFLAAVIGLIFGLLPPALVFMIGLSLVLLINYPQVDDQMDRIKSHAPSAMLMGSIILAAGSFLGIMDGSGMLRSMAASMVAVLPESVASNLHVIVGIIGLPLELLLSTDAFYFGLMPIMLEVVGSHGVAAPDIVYAMVIGNIIGTFISPFSPALWLALALTRADIGSHIRYSLLWMWGFSLAMLGVGYLLGLF